MLIAVAQPFNLLWIYFSNSKNVNLCGFATYFRGFVFICNDEKLLGEEIIQLLLRIKRSYPPNSYMFDMLVCRGCRIRTKLVCGPATTTAGLFYT